MFNTTFTNQDPTKSTDYSYFDHNIEQRTTTEDKDFLKDKKSNTPVTPASSNCWKSSDWNQLAMGLHDNNYGDIFTAQQFAGSSSNKYWA